MELPVNIKEKVFNYTQEELINKFCKEVGIKTICAYLKNEDTKEIRYYNSKNIKVPKGWVNYTKTILDYKGFPDLINNPYNFSKLINIQWDLFYNLANTYIKTNDEKFEVTYLRYRLLGLILAKSFGCTDNIELYKEKLSKVKWCY